MRSSDDALHEAAHVVVGTALGLKLVRAELAETATSYGTTDFQTRHSGKRRKLAFAIMYAAGAAWDLMAAEDPVSSEYDLKYCREEVSSAHDVDTCVKAAALMLQALRVEHRRVAAALLERDLTGKDLKALVHEWHR